MEIPTNFKSFYEMFTKKYNNNDIINGMKYFVKLNEKIQENGMDWFKKFPCPEHLYKKYVNESFECTFFLFGRLDSSNKLIFGGKYDSDLIKRVYLWFTGFTMMFKGFT